MKMLFETMNWINLLAADHAAKPPLQFKVDTLLFSLIIFVGLLIVMFQFAWKPIMEGLDAREKRIQGDIDEARAANEKAQANLKDYDARLAAATEEASAVLAQAKQDALDAKERILAEAAEEAQRTRDRALADITAAKDAAVRELAERSVDSAVTLAGSIVGRSLDKKDHAQLIEKSIERFGSGA